MRPAISLLLCLAIVSCGWRFGHGQDVSKPTVSDRIQTKVEEKLEEVLANSEIPGCSVALVLPDDVEIAVAVGWAWKENETRMTPADRMMSASIGKTYFAAMTVDLVQQGKLKIDERVSKYFADERWFDRIPNADDLTIAQLMRHQSGIPRYILNRKVWRDIMADPDKVWRPGDQLAYVYDAAPLHPAGEGWAYSDTNYILLGLILQKVSGQDVYDYVNDKFLQPHGLKDTIPNNCREIPGLVQGYPTMFRGFGIPDQVIRDGKFVFNPAMEWCGGGFACTPLDLARWARLLFSGELLTGDYLVTMTQDAAPAGRMLGQGTTYGLGVMIRSTQVGKMLGHDGGFPGYTSTMGFFPDQRIAAAFMFNSDGPALPRSACQVMVDLVKTAADELAREPSVTVDESLP